MTTYTFHIVSDYIQTASKDKARMKEIANAFKSLGHKTHIGSRDPNAHSHPEKLGCTGKNDVFVCIFGGVDIEVISDHTGYKQSNWFAKRLKNAHLMYVYMNPPVGRVSTNIYKKYGTAHDGKGNIPAISNVGNHLKKSGITWVMGGTNSAVTTKIRNKQLEGANLLSGSSSSSDTTETTEYTIRHGYDTSKHFEGYLKIDYTINNKKEIHTIYIDLFSLAKDSKYSFTNNDNLTYMNNKKYTHEINLLDYIKSVHDRSDTSSDKYYLKSVTLIRNFDKSSFSDGQLYDSKTDDASYKINLYDLGLFSGEVINQITLGVSGKTLLDSVNTVLDKCNYYHNIVYGSHRNDDYVNFTDSVNTSDPIYTFNEGIDGNIIGISNIHYSPISDLINNSVVIYKTLTSENSKKSEYRFAKKSRLNDILRFGEQTHLESLNDISGFNEASQTSYNKLLQYYKPNTTYTVKVEGLPPVKVNDFVECKTVNPMLTNNFLVASRSINIDVNDRPMIQTEYGLGDVDNKLKIKNKLADQRKSLIREKLDLNEPCHYIDSMSDNFVEYTEDVDDEDYFKYEVWV